MSVSGSWKNEYESIMVLRQAASGLVQGTYRSSTGSTGEYLVLGVADPAEPPPGQGQSLALSIYWRSILGGKGDPSWHWVSGLSGQLIQVEGVATMILMHAMVATTDFPGLAPVGTYLDKLIYTPAPVPAAAEAPAQRAETACESPIQGRWRCVERPEVALDLQLRDPETGAVGGTLEIAGARHAVHGFTDVDAQPDHVPLQGLTLTAWLPDPVAGASCVALAGSLHRAEHRLSLLGMKSRGTSTTTLYVQTTTESLTFRRGPDLGS